MLLTWILVSALTLNDHVVTSQPCQRLFMQGLDNIQLQPYVTLPGLYHITNITNDGLPAYQHETNTDEFFFYNGTQKVLVLGPGLVVAQTNGRFPRNNVQYPFSEVITGWGVFRPATKSYRSLSADSIRPLCVDADPGFQRCDSGQLTFTTELTLNLDNGQTVSVTRYEQLYGRYTDYRPMYKALVPDGSSAKVYLFHAFGHWRLGEDYTMSTSAFARVSDTALRPEFITSVWQLYYSGTWNRASDLKVRCSGNRSATVCSELQCQNGGKCITAGAQNVQCSCPRGYRGQYCEDKVPACQYFGNWTDDYNGWYYAGDSYEGSLAAWFCPSGSRPEFGYSVCENRFNHPSWSNPPDCKSLTTTTTTTTTQRPWIRTTRYRYHTYTQYRNPSQTERTDLFEDVNSWLTPTMITFIVLILAFAPFIIYCALTGCCSFRKKINPFAGADKKEEKDIAKKYQKRIEELESRTPKPENDVMIAELRQIQQQLEEEADQVRMRRWQRDRKQQKNVKLSVIISLYYYVSFWLWMLYVIFAISAKVGQYGQLFGVIATIAVICVIVLPFIFMVESYCSSDWKYIKNLKPISSDREAIESIGNAKPTVTMHAECFHYETRYRTVSYTDANGNTQTRLETYQEQVITSNHVEPYLFTHWFDSSKSTVRDVSKAGVIKIKMDLTVQFGDQTTAEDFQENFKRFQDKNRNRDTYVNFYVSTTVAGFEKRLTGYTGNKPIWINSVCFWISTIFCLGWPYRMLFNRITGNTEYSVEKVIFMNTPSNPVISNDPDHPLDPPSENAEDTIHNIKKKIQLILDHLEDILNHATAAGPSKNDGDGDGADDEVEMPSVVTYPHINVKLREVHYGPQTAH